MSQFQNWSQQKTKLLMGTFAGTAMKIRCMLTVQCKKDCWELLCVDFFAAFAYQKKISVLNDTGW